MEETATSWRPRSGLRLVMLAGAALLLGAAGPPASPKDLATIKEARSLAAEWAVVNRLAAAGGLSDTYVRAMREEAASQLETALGSMTDRRGAAAAEIAALTHLPPDAPAALLLAHARRLQAMEAVLEKERS